MFSGVQDQMATPQNKFKARIRDKKLILAKETATQTPRKTGIKIREEETNNKTERTL